MPAIPGVINNGVIMRGLSTVPLATEMLTVDPAGNMGRQTIPVGAFGSLTGSPGDNAALAAALAGKVSLSGGTMTGQLNGTDAVFTGNVSSPTFGRHGTRRLASDTDGSFYFDSTANGIRLRFNGSNRVTVGSVTSIVNGLNVFAADEVTPGPMTASLGTFSTGVDVGADFGTTQPRIRFGTVNPASIGSNYGGLDFRTGSGTHPSVGYTSRLVISTDGHTRMGENIALQWRNGDPNGGATLGFVTVSGSPTQIMQLNANGSVRVQSNGGLAVKNQANSADAALTAGAITASDHISMSNRASQLRVGTIGGSGPGMAIGCGLNGEIQFYPYNGQGNPVAAFWTTNAVSPGLTFSSGRGIYYSSAATPDPNSTDSAVIRSTTGQVDVRGNNGLRVRNYVSSAFSNLQAQRGTFGPGGSTDGGAWIVDPDNTNLKWDQYGINYLTLQGRADAQSLSFVNPSVAPFVGRGQMDGANRVGFYFNPTSISVSAVSGYTSTPVTMNVAGAITASGLVTANNNLTVSNPSSHSIATISAPTGWAALTSYVSNGGTFQTTFGLTGTNTNVFMNTIGGDFAIRSPQNRGIHFGSDNGLGTANSSMFLNATGNLGIGTASPNVGFVIRRSGTDLPALRLEDGDITVPFTGIGINPSLNANTVGAWSSMASVSGGCAFSGFTNNTAEAYPLGFVGYHGSASPTKPAINFSANKTDGATGSTTLASTELIAGFFNGIVSGTPVVTIAANGTIAASQLTVPRYNGTIEYWPSTTNIDATMRLISSFPAFIMRGSLFDDWTANPSGAIGFSSGHVATNLGSALRAGGSNAMNLQVSHGGAYGTLRAGTIDHPSGTLTLGNATHGITTLGTLTHGFQTLVADPTTVDIATGLARMVKNSTSGELRLWANDGGTMKSTLLS